MEHKKSEEQAVVSLEKGVRGMTTVRIVATVEVNPRSR